MYEVYMTDGSGIDHREYRLLKPTVWAKPPGLSDFVREEVKQATAQQAFVFTRASAIRAAK